MHIIASNVLQGMCQGKASHAARHRTGGPHAWGGGGQVSARRIMTIGCALQAARFAPHAVGSNAPFWLRQGKLALGERKRRLFAHTRYMLTISSISSNNALKRSLPGLGLLHFLTLGWPAPLWVCARRPGASGPPYGAPALTFFAVPGPAQVQRPRWPPSSPGLPWRLLPGRQTHALRPLIKYRNYVRHIRPMCVSRQMKKPPGKEKRPTLASARSCGGRIRTCDLRVMSPTSYRCSTPRCAT